MSGGEAPAAKETREGASARGKADSRARGGQRPAGRNSRATRVHARAGRAGTRRQPGDARPARRADDHDHQDRVGRAADPGPGTRALPRRAPRGASDPAAASGEVRPEADSPSRRGSSHPLRAAQGVSLGEIARRLNRDDIPTAQGGRQWWPSTVRAVLIRSGPPSPARAAGA